jgi:hypothetical protein
MERPTRLCTLSEKKLIVAYDDIVKELDLCTMEITIYQYEFHQMVKFFLL